MNRHFETPHPHTDVNLHVFSPGSPEVERMLRFRDQLRADAEDRERYAAEKRALARREWAYMQYYADAKGSGHRGHSCGSPRRAANEL